MNKKSQVAHAVISKRYKMYKAGKVWLFAGLSALVIGGLGQITASADTISTNSVYTTDTSSTTDSASDTTGSTTDTSSTTDSTSDITSSATDDE
ncbi:KxYKxGKxW signal peptide domain-containing protein [Leuconostoc mesenteroides]|uniref:KxYKxGKxW signal peptide domain-containing protein n=1 Tax=Leuconostoc mesenteroides TaxID=1245 RepID=UPI00235EE401|nr:KxYKxGKxW signal peptide domain-containing protein [Leuconostoc mesenteroides]